MEKYPKVESKIFRGGAVVGESIHFQDKMKRLKNEITFQSNLHCICIHSTDWSTEYYFDILKRLILKKDFSGVNPKINNMLPAYRAAQYPNILVSDSSIKMKEDTLVDMVAAMTDNVGLVHQMPCECY